jgi:starvation-inducible outer membrane lipoprotein
MVLADFASLKRQQLAAVVAVVQKKYPKTIVLPRLDENEKDFNLKSEKVEYRYYLCTVERALFGCVSVKYFDTKKKTNIEVASVAL